MPALVIVLALALLVGGGGIGYGLWAIHQAALDRGYDRPIKSSIHKNLTGGYVWHVWMPTEDLHLGGRSPTTRAATKAVDDAKDQLHHLYYDRTMAARKKEG